LGEQYEILEEVGHGGMGVVYKARGVASGRLAAVKVLRASLPRAILARELRESELCASLLHPNIVHIEKWGEVRGSLYVVMEFVEGGDLGRKINGTPQDPRYAAELMESLADAMHYAHEERGIIHRDLKPANVLLTVGGEPKIADFGLGRLCGPHRDLDIGDISPAEGSGGDRRSDGPPGWALTPVGAILGTPCYMAPEQAAGDNLRVGPASDIYALGAILYELLTGRPPFRGASVRSTLSQVRSLPPAPPSEVRPGIPAGLEAICLKCLQKRPEERYATARGLRDDLWGFLGG
jgi:serine/threonine-protein kinase